MVDVKLLSLPPLTPVTQVWATSAVTKKLLQFHRKSNEGKRLMKKLADMAGSGFDLFTGSSLPIRPEGNGVYRIGIDDSLFRLIGFKDPVRPNRFVVTGAGMKRGQQLNAEDRAQITTAAKILRDRGWRYVS